VVGKHSQPREGFLFGTIGQKSNYGGKCLMGRKGSKGKASTEQTQVHGHPKPVGEKPEQGLKDNIPYC